MPEAFIATLKPMLTVFAFILIGFVLRKTNAVPENAGTVLSKVGSYIFLPAQVFLTFMTYCTPESLTENYRYILYAVLCLAVSLAMGYPLSKLLTKDGKNRGVYRYALVFANYGYLGIYVVSKILGEEYLYPYLLFTLPVNLLAFLWGMNQMIPAGRAGGSPLKRLINPVILCTFAGAAAGLTNTGRFLPSFVTDSLNGLSACMAPVGMLLTGFIIGGYDVKELLGCKQVYVMTFLRLTVLPGVLMVVAYLLGADLTVLTMVLVAFGAALGMNTVVFTAAYGADTKPGAAMALVSHVFAVISVPLMYALLMAVLP